MGHLKVGVLEQEGETGWAEGQGQWLQTQFGSHPGSREHGSGGEVGLQTSHYDLECKRGRSSFLPAKGISLPSPLWQSWVEVPGKL